MIDENKLLMYLADLELSESPRDGEEESETYKNIKWFLEIVESQYQVQPDCNNCGYKFHSNTISKLNSCNDCGKRGNCDISPRLGEMCRINCYKHEEIKPQVQPIVRSVEEIAELLAYCNAKGKFKCNSQRCDKNNCTTCWIDWLTGKDDE